MSMKEYANPETARAKVEYLIQTGMRAQKAEEKPLVLDIEGHKYVAYKGKIELVKVVKPEPEEKPEPFYAFSLQGLVDYILTDVDGHFKSPSKRHIVRVVDTRTVEVITPIYGFYKTRDRIAVCKALVPDIPFDRYLEIDDFQIMVQTRFAESTNRDLILQLAGCVRKEQTLQTADDGVSQKITINRGVVTAGDVVVKNPVTLRPLRTYYEVEQPESPFIIRFNEDAEAALFEGDGGAWKLKAVENIRSWLADKLQGCNVEVIA